uniref:Uncharacterized protein n=1 Tax=Setaria viridis TaxID=4556 RepID=A0A4U6VJX6_SETVI|nr:hypothetical protein SEVIR_3G325403v2 [Setaria viridis]
MLQARKQWSASTTTRRSWNGRARCRLRACRRAILLIVYWRVYPNRPSGVQASTSSSTRPN